MHSKSFQLTAYQDEILQQVQSLVYGRLPVKLMTGPLLSHHSLQTLCERCVLLQQAVLLLLNSRIVMLQLLLLLLQLLQLPAIGMHALCASMLQYGPCVRSSAGLAHAQVFALYSIHNFAL